MDKNLLRNISYNTLLELAFDEGINASGKQEIYGCLFGRDSAITVLKMLNVVKRGAVSSEERVALLEIARRTLLTLVNLQGREFNIESGEEPGKFIHEYRKERFDHLLEREKPWFVYPDGILRNYDSLDSTPLALIAIHKYWEETADNEFLIKALSAVELGLNWIITFGDRDKDHLVEYELPKNRKYGGLVVQSWTDSHESLQQADGRFPEYPIAPVEVQGYAWLALKLWADYYADIYATGGMNEFPVRLRKYADIMRDNFNYAFIFDDEGCHFPAQALDGLKNRIKTVTGNPLLLLWATYKHGNETQSILDENYIAELIARSFKEDLFDPEAGIRTMSTKSSTYNPKQNSYHNGSFWPKLNGMAHEGLLNWGFRKEADMLQSASIKPALYFGSPIELYIRSGEGTYLEYCSSNGQIGCRQQAWSAASLLDMVSV